MELVKAFSYSLMAGLTIFFLALFWNIAEYGILFASFGSSAYLIFTKPKSTQSSIRDILGAYPLAGFFGYLTTGYILPLLPLSQSFSYALAAGIAVASTSLAMLLTGFKHAPAAGASLAFVIKQADVGAVFFLIGGGVGLLVLHKILTLLWKEGHTLEETLRFLIKELSKKR